MFKTILIESSKRMFYGLGFGIGMGTAFKLIPIERKSNKKKEKFYNKRNANSGVRTHACEHKRS